MSLRTSERDSPFAEVPSELAEGLGVSGYVQISVSASARGARQGTGWRGARAPNTMLMVSVLVREALNESRGSRSLSLSKGTAASPFGKLRAGFEHLRERRATIRSQALSVIGLGVR